MYQLMGSRCDLLQPAIKPSSHVDLHRTFHESMMTLSGNVISVRHLLFFPCVRQDRVHGYVSTVELFLHTSMNINELHVARYSRL
jgi:hypothetical protein